MSTGSKDKKHDGEEEGMTRRNFFSLAGWVGLVATAGGSAVGSYQFMFPNALYEPPTVFKIGSPGEFAVGLSEKYKKERRVWVARNERGLYVLVAICRHLGCTPNWYDDKKRFQCPCHGSIYDITGNVLGGPAPRTLWRAAVSLDPVDGQIIVDFNHRQDPDPKSTDMGLVVEEGPREVEPFFLKV